MSVKVKGELQQDRQAAALEEFERLTTLAGMNLYPAHRLGALRRLQAGKLPQKLAQTGTIRQMTLTAIARQCYQLRHGAQPADLAILCPEFLTQPTHDPMSGKGLLYRPGTKGDWLLYFIGEDGVDDGGEPTPQIGGTAGFWAGRHEVWPQAHK